ncbi:helix-turn-helix domain-containing protein [Streptomyces sp. E5N298]|uniref:ArsR/SmtB family transcription factor n=1 Tax=Streptomyces sp. E5N298 TaxID=1851983 RepID=UPI000EF5A8AB|nr:helix-turn-helix domain-containing protein [Streptomyces sp. E5N298]
MQRIHFTAEDLARTRLSPTLGQVAETVFALGLLGRPASAAHLRWRHRLAQHLRQRTALAAMVASPHGRLRAPGDLLCLVDAASDEGDRALRALGLGPDEALAAVRDVWRHALAPYWNRVLNQLEHECNARGRITMTGGVDRLLETLHSKIQWQSPVLEVPGPDRDIHLDGRGLVLVPSLFLVHQPSVLIRSLPEGGGAALVFAVSPDFPQAAGLWDEPDNTGQALGALVGRTRAAALRALTASHTTSELAETLGISSAGASQHTAVLRESGLITTHRNRNTVLHTVTPLGMALLGMRVRESGRTSGNGEQRLAGGFRQPAA